MNHIGWFTNYKNQTSEAGTDADVKIQLIGKDSVTKPTKLDNFFRDDFERGRTDKFDVKMRDIGEPLLCRLCEYDLFILIISNFRLNKKGKLHVYNLMFVRFLNTVA